jgi:allantoate deiminase
MDRCDRLAEFTDVPGIIHRTFCSPAMARLHDALRGWMTAAGMTCRVDAAGNFLGRFNPTADPDAPALLIGSHLDTVPNAGRYDGPLGVMLGLAVVECVIERETKLPFAIEVVGFSEEEGVRFGTPFIGSRALVGDCDAPLLSLVDHGGVSAASALKEFGCDVTQIAAAAIDPATVIGFIEPHIEQGPVLQSQDQPLGIVTAIAGQARGAATFIGTAGHAGTVPMELRRDALCAAAEWIAMVERLGKETPGLVATVGFIEASPNVGNVIPGETRLKIDVRHADDAERKRAVTTLETLAHELAKRRGVTFHFAETHSHRAVPMDFSLTATLERSLSDMGLSSVRLVSGAGHDAAILARHVPTAVLFIRCKDGISHHPDESVTLDDVTVALESLWRSFVDLSLRERSADAAFRSPI